MLTKTSVDRVDGWLATKEWIKVIDSKDIETGEQIKTSKLKVFKNCSNLIKNLPQVQVDEKDPNDVATEPHEPTHICDALRYFCVNFTRSTEEPKQQTAEEKRKESNRRNYINFGVI
jgi:phage terminase large subunit